MFIERDLHWDDSTSNDKYKGNKKVPYVFPVTFRIYDKPFLIFATAALFLQGKYQTIFAYTQNIKLSQHIEDASTLYNNTLLYALYGPDLDNVFVSAINISFGQKGDQNRSQYLQLYLVVP